MREIRSLWVIMRLINTSTLEIHEFPGDSDKDYAILSHTWDKEECTFQDMSTWSVKLKRGFAKIEFCCKQAAQDGLEWAWVDTLVQLQVIACLTTGTDFEFDQDVA